jgi:trehalose/maltose hydrolase-like predicted phosphorylase
VAEAAAIRWLRQNADLVHAASATLARNRALGWRAALAAHETAWGARWKASEIRIEGDDASQRAARFAV